MQEQRFTLVSGDTATISPGVLLITYLDTGEVDEIDLADLRRVKRDRSSVRLDFRGHSLTLDAMNLSDAGRMEALLTGEKRESTTRAAEQAKHRRRSLDSILLKVIGVVIAAFMLVSYVVGAVRGDDDDGGDDPRPATTATRVPTSLVLTNLSDSERDYVAHVRQTMTYIESGSTAINRHIDRSSPETDTGFWFFLSQYPNYWEDFSREGRSGIAVPRRFEQFHVEYESVLTITQEAGYVLQQAVSAESIDKLPEAELKIREATVIRNAALRHLNDLVED